MQNDVGKKVENIINIFEPDEGSIDLIYGRIGSGKTAEATRQIIEELAEGKSVYCNWRIDLSDFVFDDRQKLGRSILNFILFHKRYYKFNHENLHYIDTDNVDTEYLSNLTDCSVYIDEGQWIFDSYEGTKFGKAKRKLILHTRHLNRKLIIVTQRPTAIQVSARSNVNRFFRCTKILQWPLLILKVEEFQDMAGETVDETAKPVHTVWKIVSKKILNAYNTKYLRGGVPRSQQVYYEAYDLNFRERFALVWRNLFSFLKKRKQISQPSPFIKKLEVNLNQPETSIPIKKKTIRNIQKEEPTVEVELPFQ